MLHQDRRGSWHTVSSFADAGIAPKDEPEEKGGAASESFAIEEFDFAKVDLNLGDVSQQQAVERNEEKIVRMVRNHLGLLDQLHSAPRTVQARPENRKAVLAIWEHLNTAFESPEAGYRQIAYETAICFVLNSAKPASFEEAMEALDLLVKRKWLEETDRDPAPLRAWTRKFRIPEAADFQKRNYLSVQRAMSDFFTRTKANIAQGERQELKTIRDEMTISPEELLKGDVKGKALLYVPVQIFRNGDNRVRVNGDGFLVAESLGDNRILPKKGFGGIANWVQEAVENRAFVLAFQLDWDFPTPRKKLEEKTKMSDEQIIAYQKLWGMLKRAKSGLEQREASREEKLEWGRQVSISAEDFLLDRQPGVALLDLEQGTVDFYEDGQKRIVKDIYLLVEREEQGEDDVIQVKEAPEHLKPLIGDCLGKKFKEGQKFEGVEPDILRAIFQAAFWHARTRQMILAR